MQKLNLIARQVSLCTALLVVLTSFPLNSYAGKHKKRIPIKKEEQIVPQRKTETPGEYELLGLPIELWFIIVHQLPHKDKIRIKRVCSTIRKIVENDVVWPEELVARYMQMYGKNPGQVTWTLEEVAFCRNHYGKAPCDLTEMPVLKVESFQELDKPPVTVIWGLKIKFLRPGTFEFVGKLPNLTKLILRKISRSLTEENIEVIAKGCPKLRVLSLKHCDVSIDEAAKAIANNCPELLNLGLIWCTKATNDDIETIASKCTKLAKINLMYSGRSTRTGVQSFTEDGQFTDATVQSIAEHCSDIIVLNLSGCAQVTDESIKALKGCTKLAELILENCENITGTALVDMAEQCKALTKLDLTRCSKITDAIVQSIVQRYTKLTVLNLSVCTQITGAAIEHIVQCCPDITILNLSGTSVDNTSLSHLISLNNLKELHLYDGTVLRGDQIGEYLNSLPTN